MQDQQPSATLASGSKRQRKAPVWQDEWLVGNITNAALTQPAPEAPAEGGGRRSTGGSAGTGGAKGKQPKVKTTEKGLVLGADPVASGRDFPDGPIKVLSCRLVDGDHVEVTVEAQGRRFGGVITRSGPPANGTYIIEDSFRDGYPVNSSPCAMCNFPLSSEPYRGSESRWRRKFVRVFVSNNWTALLHLQCALWAPEVYEDGRGNLFNLAVATRRGRALRCQHCAERGATLGCYTVGCEMVFHLPCAADIGCSLEEDTYSLYCPTHAQERM